MSWYEIYMMVVSVGAVALLVAWVAFFTYFYIAVWPRDKE